MAQHSPLRQSEEERSEGHNPFWPPIETRARRSRPKTSAPLFHFPMSLAGGEGGGGARGGLRLGE